jgi:hypothetical protein
VSDIDLMQRIHARRAYHYPPFMRVVQHGLGILRARYGIDYWMTRGFYTYAEQTDLWAQGRLKPGAIVTGAIGGRSAHCFGIAVDAARDLLPLVPKLQPGWSKADYIAYGAVFEDLGLSWGGRFKKFDGPHIQWPGYEDGEELAPLRKYITNPSDQGGMLDQLARCWDHLDRERASPSWQLRNPKLTQTLRQLEDGTLKAAAT